MTHPLSDDAMLSLGRQYLHMADREGATDHDQAALRDFVPALLHRLREKAEMWRDDGEMAVLDLRFCGEELAADADDQIELALPTPE
ncbi:hypothetical protein [Novosphingobium sp. P6W]|uniref:hypothetical protein n=1 Tax=Novosphingobium sp. P6W TaxID=1609758 RepID=UPI0005C6A408|nr:hypothetical protein [Novosphingobium sp. P6W]AXB76593.1 hypothetical protein TQ38_008835 [Novosphingobium sp. P6W]